MKNLNKKDVKILDDDDGLSYHRFYETETGDCPVYTVCSI